MKKIKTLVFHQSAIKKACAALVKDGYDRNQAIGALIEYFMTDKTNPEFFNTLLKGYSAILKDDLEGFYDTKPLIRELKTGCDGLSEPFGKSSIGRKFRIAGSEMTCSKMHSGKM